MGRILWTQIEALHEEGAISTQKTYAESRKIMGTPKGLIPWNKGKKTGPLSKERKHKMSIAKKGKLPKNFALLHSPEIRKEAGLANRGKKRSDETKRRISKALIGNRNSLGAIPWHKGRTGIYSQEHLEKLRQARLNRKAELGFINSPETRRKLSIALKGKTTWNKGGSLSAEWKLKISMGNKGKKHSEKSKLKMSESRKGKKLSLEHRINISNALRGEKCYNWRGGRSTLRKLIYRSYIYRQWRSDIFTRDDFTCQCCERRGGKLEAHHIQSFTDLLELNDIKTVKQAIECDELWNINNGLTLCKSCHRLSVGAELR